MNPRSARNFSPKSITRIALLSAVTILLLMLVRLSPVADLVFMTLTSLCVAMAYVMGGRREALFTYLVSSVISLLIPGWTFAWPYYLFFGLYPLLKSAIECFSRDKVIHHKAWHFILKLLVAVGLGFVAVLILNALLPSWFTILRDQLPFSVAYEAQVAFLLLVAVLVFFIYDYALSVLISQVQRRSS